VFYLGAEDTVSLTREECKYLDFSLSIYSVQVSTARRAGLILIHHFPGRIRFFFTFKCFPLFNCWFRAVD